MHPDTPDSMDKMTIGEFKTWLTRLIHAKQGALPDFDDWKQIKAALDSVIEPDKTRAEEKERTVKSSRLGGAVKKGDCFGFSYGTGTQIKSPYTIKDEDLYDCSSTMSAEFASLIDASILADIQRLAAEMYPSDIQRVASAANSYTTSTKYGMSSLPSSLTSLPPTSTCMSPFAGIAPAQTVPVNTNRPSFATDSASMWTVTTTAAPTNETWTITFDPVNTVAVRYPEEQLNLTYVGTRNEIIKSKEEKEDQRK